MTALLGLLTLAGYQNRDKLVELLGSAGQGVPVPLSAGPAQGSQVARGRPWGVLGGLRWAASEGSPAGP